MENLHFDLEYIGVVVNPTKHHNMSHNFPPFGSIWWDLDHGSHGPNKMDDFSQQTLSQNSNGTPKPHENHGSWHTWKCSSSERSGYINIYIYITILNYRAYILTSGA